MGTGIAADFFARLGASVTSAALSADSVAFSELSDFLLDFLTARLRGDFGSIAMAPNPLARISRLLVIRILVARNEFSLRTKPLCSPPQAR
jgi:hypothetical protein